MLQDSNITKADLERVDRNIEQIRSRMESNFDIINTLLREVSTTLSSISVICPIQKEEINSIRSDQKKLEDRIDKLEKICDEAYGMTKTAKFIWGIISAIIGFAAAQLAKFI